MGQLLQGTTAVQPHTYRVVIIGKRKEKTEGLEDVDEVCDVGDGGNVVVMMGLWLLVVMVCLGSDAVQGSCMVVRVHLFSPVTM